MKIKRLITLIETLALTGLVSVGFSSWLVIETHPAIIAGRVNVEDVFDNNDYLLIKNMTFSDYCQTGFYDDFTFGTASAENPGILEFDIVIDLKKYRDELITTPSSLELNIQLGYSVSYKDNSINAFDIISRSMTGASGENGSLNSDFLYSYDGGTKTSILPKNQTIAYFTEGGSVVAPNINSTIELSTISSVNKIVVSAKYTFKLYGNWKTTDWTTINTFYVPFSIYATLESA